MRERERRKEKEYRYRSVPFQVISGFGCKSNYYFYFWRKGGKEVRKRRSGARRGWELGELENSKSWSFLRSVTNRASLRRT